MPSKSTSDKRLQRDSVSSPVSHARLPIAAGLGIGLDQRKEVGFLAVNLDDHPHDHRPDGGLEFRPLASDERRVPFFHMRFVQRMQLLHAALGPIACRPDLGPWVRSERREKLPLFLSEMEVDHSCEVPSPTGEFCEITGFRGGDERYEVGTQQTKLRLIVQQPGNVHSRPFQGWSAT